MCRRDRSEKFRAKSTAGRFLEHGRIVCFAKGHGRPWKQARVFFSSADGRGRNLNRRVETLIEAHNPTVKSQIMGQIMAANFADEAQSWVLSADGTYRHHSPKEPGLLFSCPRIFTGNSPLSGRGPAGRTECPSTGSPACARRRSGGQGSAAIVHYEPERIVVRATADDETLLGLTDAFYPGWTATVDGAQATIQQIDGLFRGVFLPAGEHEVVFHYRPAGFRYGALSLVVGLVVLLGIAWLARPKQSLSS